MRKPEPEGCLRASGGERSEGTAEPRFQLEANVHLMYAVPIMTGLGMIILVRSPLHHRRGIPHLLATARRVSRHDSSCLATRQGRSPPSRSTSRQLCRDSGLLGVAGPRWLVNHCGAIFITIAARYLSITTFQLLSGLEINRASKEFMTEDGTNSSDSQESWVQASLVSGLRTSRLRCSSKLSRSQGFSCRKAFNLVYYSIK